jgi:serine/threonine protein kinase
VIDDRYQVEGRAGGTGWGTWYLARDLDTGRQVSVKILDSRFELEHAVRQAVIDEAFALVRIRHVNVLGVERVIAREEYVGVVMEPFVGETLDAIINTRRNTIPLPEVLDVFTMVVEGVRAAHEAHLLHRDLKAANVLVDTKGIAKLVDFGLGCKDRSGARWKQPGQGLYGTLTSLAPELFGDGDWSKPQGDIYALGILLFNLVTGALPFNLPPAVPEQERLRAFAQMHAQEPLPALRSLRAGVPEVFERIVRRAAAKTPQARYADCRALLEALTEARRGLRDMEVLRRATQGEHSSTDDSPEERQLTADKVRFEEAAEALASLYESVDNHPSLVALLMKRIANAAQPAVKARLMRQLARVLDEKLHLAGRALRVLEDALLQDLASAEALQALERFAGRNRAWPEVARVLGRALEQARELPPRTASEWHKRRSRWLAEFVADREGAEAALLRALELVPGDDEALRALESLLRLASRDRELFEVLQRRARVATEPGWRRELYKEAVSIAVRAGDSEAAEQLLAEVLAAAPEETWAAQEAALLKQSAPAVAAEVSLEQHVARARQHLVAHMAHAWAELEELVPVPEARQLALQEFLADLLAAETPSAPPPPPPAREQQPDRKAPRPKASTPPPPVVPRAATTPAAAKGSAARPASETAAGTELVRPARILQISSAGLQEEEVTAKFAAPEPRSSVDAAAPVLQLPTVPGQGPASVEEHTSMSSCRAMIRDCISWMQSQAFHMTDPMNQRVMLRESAAVALAVGDRTVAEQLLREIIRVDDTCLWAFDELISMRQALGDRLEAQVLLKRRNDLGRTRGFILAAGQRNPSRLVADGKDVFWVQMGDRSESDAISQFSVMRARKDGYGVGYLVDELIGSPHVGLAADEEAVYVNPGFGSVMRANKVGGKLRELGRARAALGREDAETVFSWDELGIAVAGPDVFWTDHEGNLKTVGKSGESAPVVLPGRRRRYHGVVVDDSNVYWVESGRKETLAVKQMDKELLLSSRDEKRKTTVATDDLHRFPSGLNVRLIGQSPTHLYCASDLVVMSIQKADGEVRDLVRHGSSITSGAVHGDCAYWTDQAGTITSCALREAEPVVLCSRQPQPCAIAVDETHVYWANRGDGTIRHLQKD